MKIYIRTRTYLHEQHIYIHTYTHIHVYIYVYIHTLIRKHTHTYSNNLSRPPRAYHKAPPTHREPHHSRWFGKPTSRGEYYPARVYVCACLSVCVGMYVCVSGGGSEFSLRVLNVCMCVCVCVCACVCVFVYILLTLLPYAYASVEIHNFKTKCNKFVYVREPHDFRALLQTWQATGQVSFVKELSQSDLVCKRARIFFVCACACVCTRASTVSTFMHNKYRYTSGVNRNIV